MNFANVVVKDIQHLERGGAHSHIKGLGLVDGHEPQFEADGLVGQVAARRAAGIVVKMVQQQKICGRAILLSGQPGSGKTAVAMGIAKELGADTPFTHISASEIYSLELSKTEVLTQAIRRSIGVQITEEVDVIEGEVVELEIDRAATSTSSSARVGRMTLKTTDMESVYDIGVRMIECIQSENIIAGDVISVDKSTGRVTKLGRSIARCQDYDAIGPNTRFVACPDGEPCKRRELTHTVTLHEIDVINSRAQGFLAIFAGDTGEIKPEVRSQIDRKVNEWLLEGKAQAKPGILFIDEIHMLDVEAFSFLNRALENNLSPILVMATNRGIARIRGTDYKAPHGVPLDLLDRTLIIPTEAYTVDELRLILKRRASEQSIDLSEEALELLTQIAVEISLRYALQLTTMAHLIAKKNKSSSAVELAAIQKAFMLFVDTKRSTSYLLDYGKEFMHTEILPKDPETSDPEVLMPPSSASTDIKAA